MVQRKTAQKPKAKSTLPVKSVKKQEKKPLSNGYGKNQSKQSPTTKSTEEPAESPLSCTTENFEITDSSKQDSTTQITPSNSQDSTDNPEHIVKSEEIMSSDNPKPRQKKAEKPGTSKDNPEDNPQKVTKSEENIPKDEEKPRKRKAEKPGNSKDNPKDNPEKIAKSEENITKDEEKSRKRKAVSKKEEKPKVTEKKSALPKSKAKRQRIVLEVPSLSSIPGKVFVVGANDVGQIGLDEDVDSKEKPFLLNLPYSIIDVAAGGMHSICLSENGEVITFGCNDEGALGRVASDEEERIPKKVEIPEKIVQVSAGDSHSAALAESGQVYLWGNFRNGEGQMGLTTPDGQKQIAPVKVLANKTIVKIASGENHLACLSNDGTVYTCGCAEQGQLGRINSRVCKTGSRQKGLAALLEPEAVLLNHQEAIDDVWTESYATFLRAQEAGSVFAFGLNNYSQLGQESGEEKDQLIYFPKRITSFDDKSWQQINGGQHHTLALDGDGMVYALGRKDYGRLGLGEDSTDKSSPTPIPTLENEKCKNISCGNCVSFAVTEHGSLYSWGMSSSMLGHGSTVNEEDVHVPRLIKGELLNSWEVLKVSGGGQHALILASQKKGSSKDSKA